MGSLGSHPNVYNVCLRILRNKGFTLWIRYSDDSDEAVCSWFAEKNGYDFVADNPIELLGLAAIYEYKQPQESPRPYWWNVEGDKIWDELADIWEERKDKAENRE